MSQSDDPRVVYVDGDRYVLPTYVRYRADDRVFMVELHRDGEHLTWYFGAKKYDNIPAAFEAACAFASTINPPIVRGSLPWGIRFFRKTVQGQFYHDFLQIHLPFSPGRTVVVDLVTLGNPVGYTQEQYDAAVVEAIERRKKAVIEFQGKQPKSSERLRRIMRSS